MKSTRVLIAFTGTLISLLIASCADFSWFQGDKGCTSQTIAGEFVASGSMGLRSPQLGGAVTSYMQAIFIFDGNESVEVRDGLSSEGGNNVPWQGRGRYSLLENCVGEIYLDTKIAGGIDVRMNFDFLVSGTDDTLEIAATFVSHPGTSSGQLTLRRLEL